MNEATNARLLQKSVMIPRYVDDFELLGEQTAPSKGAIGSVQVSEVGLRAKQDSATRQRIRLIGSQSFIVNFLPQWPGDRGAGNVERVGAL